MQDLRTILDIYKSNNDLQVFIDNKKFSNFILLNGLSNVLGSVFFNEDITGIKGIMGLINIINSSKNQEQIVKLSKRLYMSYLLKQIPITSETILDNLNITDQEIDLVQKILG